MTDETFKAPVHNCNRCGCEHTMDDEVRFWKFRRPPTGFEYWALCPLTGEPILARIENAETKEA